MSTTTKDPRLSQIVERKRDGSSTNVAGGGEESDVHVAASEEDEVVG